MRTAVKYLLAAVFTPVVIVGTVLGLTVAAVVGTFTGILNGLEDDL